MAVRLIVVRHGQTPCNVQDIWHGWDDCALTDVGLAQAAAVGERLAGEALDAVYSSPTQRALQTAHAIAAHHGLVPIVDPDLRERHIGNFEGFTTVQIEAAFPGVLAGRTANYWDWRPPDGETFREVLERTLQAVRRIERSHQGQTVAIATHMGPVRLLTSHFAGVSLDDTYRMEFPSTCVSIFTVEGDRATVEVLNDAAHIRECS